MPPWLAEHRRAWLSLCASAGCQLIAGQVYGFGLFSDVLRRKSGLNLSQGAVESVAVAENLGQYCRLAGGLVYDALGAKVTIIIGCLLNSAGYFAIYIAVQLAEASGDDQGMQAPVALLCTFAGAYGQGAGWIETGVISRAVADFPANRGEAAGCLKTFFGIASAIGALAFAAFLAPARESMLLALAMCPVVLGVPLSLFVGFRSLDPSSLADSGSPHPWSGAYCLTLALVVILALHSLLASLTPFLRPYEAHRGANVSVFAMVLSLLAVLPALPSRPAAGHGWKKGSSPPPPEPIEDCSFAECLRRPRFWLVFFALASGEGAGLLVLNNLGQLVRALDNGAVDLQPVCVSVFSVANATGRLAMGRLATAEVLLLAWALAAMAAVDAMFALGEGRYALLMAMPSVGFVYGCMWSLQPLLAAELFGLRSYGAKYAMLSLAAVTGSTPLSRVIVPAFYELHADSTGWCTGGACFRGPLLCASAACAAGALAAFRLEASLPQPPAWQALELPEARPLEGPRERSRSLQPVTVGVACE